MASFRLSASALSRLVIRRTMSSASPAKPVSVEAVKQAIDLKNFDPNNYSLPLRPVTMDDTLEPYGRWKDAYEAERRLANVTLAKGILCLTSALLFVYYSDICDGLLVPNLDDIMDIEPISFEKEEGRISV